MNNNNSSIGNTTKTRRDYVVYRPTTDGQMIETYAGSNYAKAKRQNLPMRSRRVTEHYIVWPIK